MMPTWSDVPAGSTVFQPYASHRRCPTFSGQASAVFGHVDRSPPIGFYCRAGLFSADDEGVLASAIIPRPVVCFARFLLCATRWTSSHRNRRLFGHPRVAEDSNRGVMLPVLTGARYGFLMGIAFDDRRRAIGLTANGRDGWLDYRGLTCDDERCSPWRFFGACQTSRRRSASQRHCPFTSLSSPGPRPSIPIRQLVTGPSPSTA